MLVNGVFDLRGYVCASEDRSGFVVPVFRTVGSNRLFGQVVDAAGLVAGFEPLDPASFIAVDAGQQLALSVGEPAVWAYRLPDEIPVIGPRSMVAEQLRHLLQRITDPLLRLQAAEFCDAPTARTEAWRGSFDMLARTAPASAEAWRDLVVLPRQVRNAVATALAAQGTSTAGPGRSTALDGDLGSAVSVDVDRGALRVTLDAALFDLLQSRPSALAEIEADVTEVRKAFRLRFDPIARGASEVTAPPERKSRFARPIVAAGDHAVAVLDALLRTPERRTRPSGRGGHGPAHLRTGEQPLVIADREAVLHREQASSEKIVHLLGGAPEPGTSILPFVFAVSANQAALVDRLASLADGARLRGWIPVAVVPHLPDPALMRDPDLYRSLLRRIDGAFLRTWLVSEQSAHGRSGLPFGPSRSVDAAAGRLAGLLASLPPATEFQGKRVYEDGAIEVDVLSSAVAGMDLSPPRLLERALGRAADAALRIAPATEADAELPAATASLRMDDAEGLLNRMVPGGSQVTWTHPHRQSSAHSSLRLSRVRWTPMDLSEFDDACMAELDRHGWRIGRTEVAFAVCEASKDETRIPIAFKASGGSTASRPLGSRILRRSPDDVLLLTDATIHRGDFARQLVDGRMPLHFGRIASLATIWRQRHLHLIRALRGTAALQDRTIARASFDLLKAMQRSDRIAGALSSLIADGADLDEERSFVARLPDAVRVDLAIVTRDGHATGASRDVGLVLTAAGWSIDDRAV